MIIINGLVQFFIKNASINFCMLVSRHGIHGARMGLTFYFVYKCPHKKTSFLYNYNKNRRLWLDARFLYTWFMLIKYREMVAKSILLYMWVMSYINVFKKFSFYALNVVGR